MSCRDNEQHGEAKTPTVAEQVEAPSKDELSDFFKIVVAEDLNSDFDKTRQSNNRLKKTHRHMQYRRFMNFCGGSYEKNAYSVVSIGLVLFLCFDLQVFFVINYCQLQYPRTRLFVVHSGALIGVIILIFLFAVRTARKWIRRICWVFILYLTLYNCSAFIASKITRISLSGTVEIADFQTDDLLYTEILMALVNPVDWKNLLTCSNPSFNDFLPFTTMTDYMITTFVSFYSLIVFIIVISALWYLLFQWMPTVLFHIVLVYRSLLEGLWTITDSGFVKMLIPTQTELGYMKQKPMGTLELRIENEDETSQTVETSNDDFMSTSSSDKIEDSKAITDNRQSGATRFRIGTGVDRHFKRQLTCFQQAVHQVLIYIFKSRMMSSLVDKLKTILKFGMNFHPLSRQRTKLRSTIFGDWNHQTRYIGEIDKNGEPHGIGCWKQYNYSGESLVGYWRHGIPVAPFSNVEFGTGNSSLSIKIGYARTEGTGYLKFGTADVECCASGQFYKRYPHVVLDTVDLVKEYDGVKLRMLITDRLRQRHGKEKMDINSIIAKLSKMLKTNRFFNNSKIAFECDMDILYGVLMYVSLLWLSPNTPNFGFKLKDRLNLGIHNGIYISGFSPIISAPQNNSHNANELKIQINRRNAFEYVDGLKQLIDVENDESRQSYHSARKQFEEMTSELVPVGWKANDASGTVEALVYIHGLRTSQDDAMKTISQVTALGKFPSHIKVFVFSWPSGTNVLQYFKARKNANKAQIHLHLCEFFKSLSTNYVRSVHIICHSMGARLLLSAFKQKEMQNLFSKMSDKNKVKSFNKLPSLNIESLTFLSPDYPLMDFINTDFATLYTFTHLITIFADQGDAALRTSEIVNQQASLGRNVFNLSIQMDDLGSVANGTAFSEHEGVISLERFSTSNIIIVERTNKYRKKLSNFPLNATPVCMSRVWLDVDIIDTTVLDSNVGALRHSQWVLNREMVDDMR